MYYNDYEDYMKSVLGYSNMNQNTYDNNCNCGMNYNNYMTNRNNSASNIEHMYPEIYKVINPMVCRMCDNNNQPISEYLIEQMTDDIYDNVLNRTEIQNVINVSIGTREISENEVIEKSKIVNNITNSNSSNSSNLQNSRSASASISAGAGTGAGSASSNISNNIHQKNETQKVIEERETRSPQPRRRNTLLRDLIRILILNRFNRPQRPPVRPPFRPGPGGQGGPNFPYPGMPGGPGPRPPMLRDNYNYESNDYMPYM